MNCCIDLYSGLLGCGKTSLIKQLLETEYQGTKVAIIENEIGKINFDSEELARPEISITKITNGCVCCTIQGELTRSIELLIQSEHPDYIVIEPTGAADIRSLLAALAMVKDASLRRRVMVVNAKKLLPLLSIAGPFFREQIESAACIYMNFTDSMTAEKITEAEDALWSINPKLAILKTPLEEITAHTFTVFSDVTGESPSNHDSSKSKPATKLRIVPLDNHTPGKIQAAHKNKLLLYTLTLEIKQRLTLQQIDRLKQLLNDDSHCQIWRAKGILILADGSRKRLDLTFGDFYEKQVDSVLEEQEGRLVLIGKKLNRQWLLEQIGNL